MYATSDYFHYSIDLVWSGLINKEYFYNISKMRGKENLALKKADGPMTGFSILLLFQSQTNGLHTRIKRTCMYGICTMVHNKSNAAL